MIPWVSFEQALATRSAAEYAAFLLPHLSAGDHLLDLGCGSATIALGLAQSVARVTALDLDVGSFEEASRYAAEHSVANVSFVSGNVFSLDFPDDSFDACLCHSLLEAVDRPLSALLEIARVLRPGGVLGAACVEYGGLILGGPQEELLRRFYAIRESLWLLIDPPSNPYLGRDLRGLLHAAGFENVLATTAAISYGTADMVRSFGLGRAQDCRDEWYSTSAQEHGLADSPALAEMERAWLRWSESEDAYASFTWCRSLGWKPNPNLGP